jgi:hypothetical protein
MGLPIRSCADCSQSSNPRRVCTSPPPIQHDGSTTWHGQPPGSRAPRILPILRFETRQRFTGFRSQFVSIVILLINPTWSKTNS